LAILLVLVRHAYPLDGAGQSTAGSVLLGMANLTWSGVDLFFVLSGFLITGILFDAKDQPHYFRNFYARRTLRVFPLYYGMVLLCTVVFPCLGVMKEAVPSGSSAWYWLYVSNFRSVLVHHAGNGWLGFFWSLAVEEHFYLLWPAVIYRFSRQAAIKICVGCVVVAWSCRFGFILAGDWVAPYVLTPCRMDGLASGALIALAARGPGGIGTLARYARPCAAISGVLVLLIGVLRNGSPWDPIMQLIGFPGITLFFAALLILVVTPGRATWFRALFESRFLRTGGKYSYGIYVLHATAGMWIGLLPFCFRHPFPSRLDPINQLLSAVLIIAALFAMAFASWHIFEKHFLRLKRFFEYAKQTAPCPPLPVLRGRAGAAVPCGDVSLLYPLPNPPPEYRERG
jgi:peptidoglycan/LPS O-acetylase OafA/YrhL